MDIEEEDSPPTDINLTACLVLNQRDDEQLGFDFVSFPERGEVLGVVNLAPGAHFVYVKEGEPNDEVERPLGEFIYILQGKCAVLKRSKSDEGPLFESLGEDEARNYHSALVAGHFHGKLSRIPEQLQQLWRDMTEYITPDVIRLLRPIVKTRRDESKTNKTIERSEGVNVNTVTPMESADSAESGKLIVANSDESECTKLHSTGEGATNAVQPLSIASVTNNGEDTADDYRGIVRRMKDLKNRSGLLCETFQQKVDDGTKGTDRMVPAPDSTVHDHEIIPEMQTKEPTSSDRLLEWEAPRDQCTIYYSDLQKVNREMNLSKDITPSGITALHLDTTHVLDSIVSYHLGKDTYLSKPEKCEPQGEGTGGWKYACVLGEYQYAFCVFMLNFHYVSFEHWKNLFRILCNAESFILDDVENSKKVLKVIKLHLETFESDLYDPGNFFAYHLSSLYEIITDNQPHCACLLEPFQAIRDTFKLKFGISLEDIHFLHDGVQVVDT
ncbi:uncharacterized protein BXIN_0193 [Babesia sp. Xinjiang]|uniref:uncharacterized protein n=1 Tax=Babesia sp. Xinjiang TaxID=462227 RepID=UPI000A256639|nr:uncharacterized protein BXIN_0193 [Babesia sp. Xinjiang]ORM39835.1 hypothetical protein BXIN_0193 [Babesia sp. Xinjiang]